jgi:1,4-dihydroxy-2-naphthoyl-CoA hydrolase
MSIWYHKSLSLDQLHGMGKGTMSEYLGIKWHELGPDYLSARMPVDHRTKQPYGLLHGGASCVLAETVGSFASSLVINPERSICVGLEINANHIRAAREGFVIGTARPVHLGANTHVWDIRLTDEGGKLICISRLTVAILPNKDRFKEDKGATNP